MKTDVETLRDSFWMGYDTYWESRLEADQIWNFYHNRQWDSEAVALLDQRGQPRETFNIIKLMARMLVGYYSTTVNTVVADPVQESDQTVASLLTDSIQSVLEANNMAVEGDKIKLSGIVSGLMCTLQAPYKTGERDQFGRPLYEIRIEHVPDYELVLDPMSTKEDYSDARFLHRFKWLPKESVIKMFGKAKTEKCEEYYNYLNVEEAEYEYAHGEWFHGRYRVFDNYLITHTVIEDDDERRWSIYWCGPYELERKEITYKEVKWPYRVVKLHTSNTTEYYGVFREVIETQKAINQALIKLQLMVNTQKVFVETNAVEDVSKFTDAVNRVNGVIPVKALKGIQVESLGRDALEQYAIIDKAFDRVQRMLNVNDSFLGQAFASDSGRKVKLQQNATIMALRYITVRIESFYQLLGQDIARLIKQYYTAEQALRVTDEVVGQRFVQLNQPALKFSGQMDAQGQPIMEPMFEQIFNPEDNKPEITEDGSLVFAPIPEQGTEIQFSRHDIRVEAVNYNDEDEKNQILLESVMSGQVGQMMSQIDPAGFFQMASLSMRSMKTKYSPEIAKILNNTSAMLSQSPEDEDAAASIGGQGQMRGTQKAKDTKLPTNTEGAAA